MRQALLLAGQVHELQRLGNSRADLMFRLADHLHRKSDILVHRLRGQEAEVLEDCADLAA